MHILEDLYLGAIHPNERCFTRNSQYAQALDETVKAEEVLHDTMTEEQQKLFENFAAAQRQVNVITDFETFCQGFKLGAKIMLDVLSNGQMREI